jgi:hypothetical protein
LKEAKDDHLQDVLGDPAQEGSGGYYDDAKPVELPVAVDVSQTAEDDPQAYGGDLKGDERPRDA